MGVLILDMKFPKTCAACEWSRYSFPNAWCGRTHKTTDIEIAKNGRPDWCPLVNIPPHGRLIDGDVAEVIHFTNEDADGKDFYDGILFAADFISQQPTIIEAEDG